jgi:NADH-quinone oxidoreductase subunit H
MYFHIKELGFRCFYFFFSFLGSWLVFFIYSTVWLECIVISFNTQASGVFFCLGSLIYRSLNISGLLAILFVAPFLLFQFGCYCLPRLFIEERVSFIVVCCSFVSNFFICVFVWWFYLLPLFYFVFISWFSYSGLAITYIPEITALIEFTLFLLITFVFVSQVPSFLIGGVIFGFWDSLTLGSNRIWFYFVFVFISTLISPPEFRVQLALFFTFFFSFEFTLFISSFIFVSKVFLIMSFIVRINGHFTSVAKNVTILQACESVNCFIPRFCYQSILNIAGNCRMCLVSVYGSGKPVVSCTVLVSPGISIYTTRFFVSKSRESVLEFLLINHPLDCPVCDQGGICDLQEQTFTFGLDRSRFFNLKRSVTNKYLGPVINTVINRCIQCTRCVRFLSEHTGSFWDSKPTLFIAGRGVFSEITTYSLAPLINSLSGNIIDLCPVGALTKKAYPFMGRPWESRTTVSIDLSSASIDKVYFSTLTNSGLFVTVSAINGTWIRNQTRFSYDALCFSPGAPAIPGTFKLPLDGSVFLGSDLSLVDLMAISFYCDSLVFDTTIFSRLPLVDRTRPSFWGLHINNIIRQFDSFDFIILVGAGILQVAPSLFAAIRRAFCSGSFVCRFGPINGELMVVFCGGRFSDFIRFVFGYHRCCLPFSNAAKPLILFLTSLFSANYACFWTMLIDKLRSFGCSISFINVYVNELAYFYAGSLGAIKPLGVFSGTGKAVSIFGYFSTAAIEFLWATFVSIEFYVGCWPISRRSYRRIPLAFQATSVCSPSGLVIHTVPLVSGTSLSRLFDFRVGDILHLALGIKYWSMPLFLEPNISIFRLNWVEPFDFYAQISSCNCLIQFPVGWVTLVGWVERSYICRQFQLFRECIEFNFLLVLSLMVLFFIGSLILEGLVLVLFLLLAIAFFTVAERKILSSIQRRRGPNVVGLFGLTQALSDGLKLFLKESILPTSANSLLFFIAPILTFSLSLLLWVCLPMGPNLVFVDLPLGVLYVFAISSLGVYGVLVAGWSSNSVYAFFGALRSTAQIISYEVSIGFILVAVLLCCGSMNLRLIVESQREVWFCFPLLPAFIIFVISILAETNRHPFDLPEAESELVSGYNVEYSAIGFALFFLGEYGSIIAIRALASLLFLGGWLSPLFVFSSSIFWIALKTLGFICFFIIARAAFPRYRYDQLMRLGWKVFLPIALGHLIFRATCLFIFDGLALLIYAFMVYIFFSYFVYLSIALFIIGLSGLLLHRRNVLILLIAIELLLLAVNLFFVVSSIRLDDIRGQVMALYVLTVAAAESAIGLALLVVFFGVRGSVRMNHINRMQS